MSITILLSAVMFLFSCGQKGNSSNDMPSSSANNGDGFVIEGLTQNYPIGKKVLLQKVRGRQAETLDTSSIKADGTFQLSGTVGEKTFGRLLIDRTPVFLILDNGKITVSSDRNDPKSTQMSGGQEINSLQSLTSQLQGSRLDKNFISNFVDTVKSPLVAYVAMSNLQFAQGMDVYEKVEKRLKNELPSSEITQDLSTFIQQNKAQAQAKKQAEAKTAIGSMAADISFPNPEGKVMSLSDLKGKVVLLDFWASWCGPCRKENPHVVKTYKQYKDQGFEVFSVSLDGNADRWKKAIQQDNLIWPYHVSDLKKWQSAPAAAYGVRSIPATFLIGRDGKIIGKNLRGPRLDQKLKEVFGEV